MNWSLSKRKTYALQKTPLKKETVKKKKVKKKDPISHEKTNADWKKIF